MMRITRFQVWLPALLLAGLFVTGMFFPVLVMGKDAVQSKRVITGQSAIGFPVITLSDWRDSSQDTRYSFLVGFATALEIEKEWQGEKPLSLDQSLNNSWIRGFDGLTFKQISNNINNYIAANPQEVERPLVEYLWYTFAQPKVTEKVSKDGYMRRHKTVKGNREAVMR